MTLAERCYDREYASQEIFNTVHNILTGTSTENCLSDGFVWRVLDTSVDQYDESIEVILQHNSEPLTREEVDRILDLGFGQVYESLGETGRQWTKLHGPHSCHPRMCSDQENIQIQKLKAQIRELQESAE